MKGIEARMKAFHAHHLVFIACLEVEDHDPARAPTLRTRSSLIVDCLAIEGYLRPIGGPCRGAVAKALWGMGDLADVGSIRVHGEDGALGPLKIYVAAKDDQTVGGSWASEAPRALVGSSATALALVVLSSTATL